VYLPATTAPFDDTQRTLAELREQLRRAVETENFELAAELRDQIRGME
jgi:protein-arginine kinase activator protein McsA